MVGRASRTGAADAGRLRPVTNPERAGAAVTFTAVWEDEVLDAEHAALAGLLRTCFPRSGEVLTGARSWISGRPELRVVGHASDRPVAHLGACRRFLRHPGGAVPVADVGLVGVEPARRGTGVGAGLLARAAAELRGLGLPFAFLTCGEQVAGFYARAGWRRVDNPLRMIRRDGRVQVYGGVSMCLPLRAGADWPSGRLDRDGYEL